MEALSEQATKDFLTVLKECEDLISRDRGDTTLVSKIRNTVNKQHSG